MSIFGNTATATSSDNNWSDYKGEFLFTLSESGDVSKLTAWIGNQMTSHAVCHVKALIYGGDADSLLATGTEVTIDDNRAQDWIDLPFASPVSLTAEDYYLGFIADSDADGLEMGYSAGSGGAGYYNIDTYADGPTDPFGDATGFAWQGCLYATYTATGSGLTVTRLLQG